MFTTITDLERSRVGVSQLPDAPDMTSTDLKRQFDSTGNLAIDKFILHIDEITADTAADNIGAVVPDGVTAAPRLQPILNAIAVILGNLSTASHTHENKAVLDDILNVIYPVGSIFSTVNSLYDPSANLGGTWEAYTWTGDTSGLYHFVRIS